MNAELKILKEILSSTTEFISHTQNHPYSKTHPCSCGQFQHQIDIDKKTSQWNHGH